MDTNDICHIRVKGHLDERWSGWFDGITIALTAGGDSIITGVGLDQAALYAILNHVRDLGLELISVQRVPAPDETDPAQ